MSKSQDQKRRIDKRNVEIKIYEEIKKLAQDLVIQKEKEIYQQQKLQKFVQKSAILIQQYGFSFVFALINLSKKQKPISSKKNQTIQTLIFEILINLAGQYLIKNPNGNMKLSIQICMLYSNKVIAQLSNFLILTTSFKTRDQKDKDNNKQKKVLEIENVLKQKLLYMNTKQKQTNELIQGEKNYLLNQRSIMFMQLAKQIQKYLQKKHNDEQSEVSLKKQYNQLASIILSKSPNNIYQEMLLNRFKQIIQRPYKKDVNKTFKHCCDVFISKNQNFKTQQTQFHQHKNYHWPITLDTIIKHVKKTIVGFLNKNGGIIYVGMKQSQNGITTQGIALSRHQQIQFFEWVHKLTLDIYPKIVKKQKKQIQKFDLSLKAIREREKIETCSQYFINKYISLQFISLVDLQTYLDCYKEQNDSYRKLYLVKIKIKPGTKAQTFHLLKQNGQIQCFQRQTDMVKKLSFSEFIDLYSNRVDTYLNSSQQKNQRGNACKNCRFDTQNKDIS